MGRADRSDPGGALLTLVDTHCHLTHPRLRGETWAVLDRAAAAGVVACVTIGTGIEDARAAATLASEHAGRVACAAGLDPFSAHAAGSRFADDLAALGDLLAGGGFAALGEIGLEYHHPVGTPAEQRARLLPQLDLAARHRLPVVLHVRDAHDDLRAILADRPELRGVVHSFTAGPAEAEAYLALGWHLAFNGIATFPSATAVREAAALVPAHRILLETDSPFLAPAPRRGARCEPAFVADTARALAAVRAEAPEELAAATTANARKLFGL